MVERFPPGRRAAASTGGRRAAPRPRSRSSSSVVRNGAPRAIISRARVAARVELLGVLALGDVAEVADEPRDARLVEVVRRGGLEPAPRRRRGGACLARRTSAPGRDQVVEEATTVAVVGVEEVEHGPAEEVVGRHARGVARRPGSRTRSARARRSPRSRRSRGARAPGTATSRGDRVVRAVGLADELGEAPTDECRDRDAEGAEHRRAVARSLPTSTASITGTASSEMARAARARPVQDVRSPRERGIRELAHRGVQHGRGEERVRRRARPGRASSSC